MSIYKELNLKKLDLKVTYRSNENDILNEFYIPCLRNSVLYKRGVGFFTSSFLAEAAKGLVDFINYNNGHMYLIVSPRLTNFDIDLIRKGYELKQVINNNIEKEINNFNIVDKNTLTRVKNLVWMIANNKLDIKIAIPETYEDDTLYHEKIGIFIDNDSPIKNIVAFSGSMNETHNGLISNYESIDISISWSDGLREKERVVLHNRHFDEMWNGNSIGLRIMDFPEALKKKLIQNYDPEGPSIEPGKKRELYPFQNNAIDSWINSNYKGILSMATGSGKTFTSIKAIGKVPDIALTLVIVPSIALINQWEEEIINEYGNNCIIRKVSSEEEEWLNKISILIKALKFENKRKAFIISSIQSASKIPFQEIINNFSSEKLAIIVDEVHRSGAKKFQLIFNMNAKYRIGLSATPERQWDDEGNQAIFDYFGPTIFEYSLSEAIADGRLSKYYYYTKIVALTSNELRQFREISISISTMLNKIFKIYPNLRNLTIPKIMQNLDIISPEQSKRLRSLYLRRVEIIKRSESKYTALAEILKSNSSLKKCLVYCNDLDHVKQNIKIMHDLGYIPYEYSSDIDAKARENILRKFRNKNDQNSFLVAVKCLDEGIDIPICDSAIFISCSRSEREFIQRRGRVLRLDPSKKYSTLYDIVVLPFVSEKEAYPLNLTEFNYIREELKRVKIFSSDAINKKDFDFEKMLNFYNNYTLK